MFALKEHQILLSSQFEKYESEIRDFVLPKLNRKHFIILSSGTTGGNIKGYALSEEALFANANAVNKFYGLNSEDIWALSLPHHHIGGLSVLARAHLLGNKVITFDKWNPETWLEKVIKEDVTVSTIVPTQLFDLLKLKRSPPEKLKFLIVGGDFLSDKLESLALDLGWPVYRTFGMTEVCSQLASSHQLRSKSLEILPIHKTKIESDRLLVKSEALFTLQFTLGEEVQISYAKEFCDPDGFFITQDMAELHLGTLIPLGRLDEKIKISGRLYDLRDLKNKIERLTLELNHFKLVEIKIETDERKGQTVSLLATEDVSDLEPYLQILSPLVPDKVVRVGAFQRTDLGKLKK